MLYGPLRKLLKLSLFSVLVRNRWVVGILAIGMLWMVIPLCLYLWTFTMQHWGKAVDHKEVDHLIHVVDGVAMLFITIGVIFESRSILRPTGQAVDEYEARLDHHAESEGLEILVAGLAMETLTEVLDMPNDLVNSSTHEAAFAAGILLMVVYAVLCTLDLALGSLVRRYLLPPGETSPAAH